MSGLRRALAVLVWLLASVTALLSLLLCVTLILLPLGIPLFAVALRMYAYGVKLMLPRNVVPSPADAGAAVRKGWRRARKNVAGMPAVKAVKKTAKKRKTRTQSLTRALWRDALR
jgi:hypothetical protein